MTQAFWAGFITGVWLVTFVARVVLYVKERRGRA
jgi:hypothetical protein